MSSALKTTVQPRRAAKPVTTIRVKRAFGAVVEGEALVSTEGFSPRYDLDRWSGLISRPGHALEGHNIKDKILITPSAKGGIAAGWRFMTSGTRALRPRPSYSASPTR